MRFGGVRKKASKTLQKKARNYAKHQVKSQTEKFIKDETGRAIHAPTVQA